MKNITLEGLGKISGGEYDVINIEGVGDITGDIKVSKLIVEGVLKCNGSIEADEMNIEGVITLNKSVRVKELNIEGVVNQKKEKIEADHIYCEGVLNSDGEISAEKIEVEGHISAPEVYGEYIKIINYNRMSNKDVHFNIFGFGFHNRKGKNRSSVDVMEATTIELSNIRAGSVRGNNVTIGANCIIEEVECDGSLFIDPRAKVGKVNGQTS
jgi:cytoskeletal protein CcmA (bactofilin family)